MSAPLYSILITAYECRGKGTEYLQKNLDAIFAQTYRPLQVVISDHSRNDAIEQMVEGTTPTRAGVDVIYVRFAENYGNPSANWNNAKEYATGDLLQPLALDDRLSDATAVARTVAFIAKHPTAMWFACGHIGEPGGKKYTPWWNANILQTNSISGPSAIVVRSALRDVHMDPQFIWYLDLDWYYRLWQRAGPPTIFPETTWINLRHDAQLTNTVCDTDRQKLENARLLQKYGSPLPRATFTVMHKYRKIR